MVGGIAISTELPRCFRPLGEEYLRALACDLAERAGLSTVITPEYNEGHHDHFHLDVRPHDARLFVR